MVDKSADSSLLGPATTIGSAIFGSALGVLFVAVLKWHTPSLLLVLFVLLAIPISSGVALLLMRNLAKSSRWPDLQDVSPPERPIPQSTGIDGAGQAPARVAPPVGSPYPAGAPYPNGPYVTKPPSPPVPTSEVGASKVGSLQQPQLSPPLPTHAVIAIDPPQAKPNASVSEWWKQSGPRPGATIASARREAPDITSYVDSGQIVQCPRCAAFTIDVKRVEAGFRFYCHACGNEFAWKRDEEWPAWKVSPRSRLKP
jgi:hypothetical protein